MTSVLSPTASGAVAFEAVAGRPRILADGPTLRRSTVLRQPSYVEQVLVVATVFVLYHQTPNAWFATELRSSDYSNAVAAVVQLSLMVVGFTRVAGSFDHMISLIRSEPTVFAFAALAFVSILWSADPGETLRRSVMFGAVTLYAGYLVVRFPLQRILQLLAWMFVGSGLLNLLWIVALPVYGVDRVGNFTGVFSQKNELGYLSALAVLTLLLAGAASRRVKPVFYAGAVLQVVLLVGSSSKTMLVAGLLPILLTLVYRQLRSRRTLPGAVFLCLAGAGTAMMLAATAHLNTLARALGRDVSFTGRVPLWEAVLDVAFERPLLGVGWAAAFGGFFSPAHEVWVRARWQPGDAHNALLQIVFEVGLVGAALFLWSYIRGVVRAIRIVALVPGSMGLWPLAMLSLTLLASITESGLQSDYLGWTIYLVAVLSVGGHLKQRAALGLSVRLPWARSRGPGRRT